MTYTILWLIWLVLFTAIEGAAICNKRAGDTLSEHVWKWCSIGNKGVCWKVRRLALLAFLAWLSAHFLTGGAF